ncbi:ARM repeat-containing [Pyrrhoderma noxium]|uniref:Pumilio homology domain family member 3 n=1 Tax=Pyrrhoderma noxium TaxID=2282107 RepID=A0A286UUK1_9AGAM|nr:ARM repeat-containing [Pyrrhoderma noxium]
MPLFGVAPALRRSLVDPRDANAMRVRGQIRAVWPRISEKNFLRVSSYIIVLPFSFAVAPVDRKKHVVRSRSPSFFSVPLTSALLPFLSLSPSQHRYVLSQHVVGLHPTPQSGSAPSTISLYPNTHVHPPSFTVDSPESSGRDIVQYSQLSTPPTLNSNWQVWGSGAQRQPSGSSNASVADVSSTQRDTWASSRPSSGSWELPQTTDLTESPQKKDYSQLDPQSPMNPGPRNRNSSGLSARIDGQSPGVKSASRYGSVPSPTAVGFSSNVQYGSQTNGNSNFESTSVDDLTMGLRSMSVGDEYNNQGSYRPSGNMPQPQNAPPIRGPQMMQPHQARASFGGYTPQGDYSAYYAGPSGVDYAYGYSSNSDATIYGSPAPANATPQNGNVYGMTTSAVHPVHADMRQAGMYYDFGGSARPPASQYFYQAQPMLHYAAAAPHSPMQSTAISQMPPASLTDKKRELQYAIQQQQQLSHQLYASTLNHGRKLEGGDSSGVTLRSPLLDEFRANKSRKWELKDIFGYIVEFSGDQHGSRFIQQKLETATSDEKQIVFDEIVPNAALQLIQDVFGNYVVQKLFEHGTQIQKSVLAGTMEGHILTLSLQMYGCRVVQKAVEYILPDQQAAFVKELDSHVLKCVKDANGNHVIQKLIERVAPERLGFVQAFRGNVYELSTHPYGCRVLQRCFEHLKEEQTRPLLDELHKYTINLMQDQFGNYVVQFVLENGPAQDRNLIIAKLRGQMLQMAKHKFASNVCEKALVTADSENRRLLIEEIMTPKADGVSPIVTMMKDQYANYVLQRALTVVESEQKDVLISKIRPQLVTMRRYSSAYSKHLISIERLLEKASSQSVTDTTKPEGFRSEGEPPHTS